jgi:hypothetical protein
LAAEVALRWLVQQGGAVAVKVKAVGKYFVLINRSTYHIK